jgi:hypothetical protein
MYGRRLVLEWAEKDPSIQQLVDKVSKQYASAIKGQQGQGSTTSSTKKQLKRYFESETNDSSSKKGRQEDDEEED